MSNDVMHFEQDTHETPVIFRKFGKREGGAIIALFPAEPFALTGYDCTSYTLIGQHSAADLNIVRNTKPATPEEYAEIARELEGFGYRLKPYRRVTSKHRAAFLSEQRRLRYAR